jgi:hypothetical protein
LRNIQPGQLQRCPLVHPSLTAPAATRSASIVAVFDAPAATSSAAMRSCQDTADATTSSRTASARSSAAARFAGTLASSSFIDTTARRTSSSAPTSECIGKDGSTAAGAIPARTGTAAAAGPEAVGTAAESSSSAPRSPSHISQRALESALWNVHARQGQYGRATEAGDNGGCAGAVAGATAVGGAAAVATAGKVGVQGDVSSQSSNRCRRRACPASSNGKKAWPRCPGVGMHDMHIGSRPPGQTVHTYSIAFPSCAAQRGLSVGASPALASDAIALVRSSDSTGGAAVWLEGNRPFMCPLKQPLQSNPDPPWVSLQLEQVPDGASL